MKKIGRRRSKREDNMVWRHKFDESSSQTDAMAVSSETKLTD